MNVEFEPELVPVKVDPAAKLNSCYFNVGDKVNRRGREIHYGCAIW